MQYTRLLPGAMLVAAALAGVSCSDAGPLLESSIATNARSYTAVSLGNDPFAVTVVATYRNLADTSVILERCFPDTPYPTYDVELVAPANAEGAAYRQAWSCVGHDNQIVVAPKGSRTDTIPLRGPNGFIHTDGMGGGHYIGLLEGVFRLSYGGARSNTFTIQLPAGAVAAAIVPGP